jgi:hypothetical protein
MECFSHLLFEVMIFHMILLLKDILYMVRVAVHRTMR